MANIDKNCYPLSENQDGFNRICVTVENPFEKESNVEIELYRYESMVLNVPGQRVYSPQQRVCRAGNPTSCYRKYEALRVISETPDMNVEMYMRLSKRSTCLNGTVAIREQSRTVELNVMCANPSWN